jgi:hypothetical protein
MSKNLALALLVFVSFTVFTVVVGIEHGPLGFVSLALEGGWGLQMLLDVGISLGVASFWIVPDARRHGINPWPYLVACLGLGSIAALAYVVHRELKAKSSVRAFPVTA